MKKRFIPLITALCISAAISGYAANIPEDTASSAILYTTDTPSVRNVVLKIDGKYLNSTYAPYVNKSGTTMVPLRAVMEQLGWTVNWDNRTQSITIDNGISRIKLQIGSLQMNTGRNIKNLSAAPILVGNVTYIPIRAVAEALGATVGWDGNNSTASIYTKNYTSTLTIADYRVKVGAPTTELITKCGEPTYKTIGENGLVWYVYANYPSAFMAVATDGGLVCGYYTNSMLFSTSEGYVYRTAITDYSKEYQLIDNDGYNIRLYYDTKAGILCGISYMLDGFSGYHNVNTVLSNQARMGLDILNSFRYIHGKSALSWSEAAAASCVDHANYMSEIGSLTHTGRNGSSALERFLTYNPGASWTAWGENICAEADNIFTCMNGWINSDYHRNIMLSDKTHAGIGFVYSPYGKYKYCAAMFLYK